MRAHWYWRWWSRRGRRRADSSVALAGPWSVPWHPDPTGRATGPDLAAITVRTLAIDPGWTSTLMIGSPNGVFRSSNESNSTVNVSYGIPTGVITQLAYHTNGTGLLFAVTPSTCVFSAASSAT